MATGGLGIRLAGRGHRLAMRSGVGWDVTRTGQTVRIDVNAGLSNSEDASTAIIAATVEHLLD